MPSFKQKVPITFQKETRVGNYPRFALQKLQARTIAVVQAIGHAIRILIEFVLKLCNEGQSNNKYYSPMAFTMVLIIIIKQIKLI